ncbi:MAG: alpha amylase C-terminal domain-containing protein, partial [Candidatus Eremiobacteraeota bacterium]|nr:alpha amylase C-terminal domain-containing protein [Candidatus Eremiobacteraeota bacterium]
VGLEGGYDPDNRRMMDFDRDPELRGYFTKLTDLRNHSDALRRGTQREMWRDDNVYAFSRTHDQEEVIAVFHNGDHQTSRSIPLRAESPLKEGTLLRDQISGREVRVNQGRLNVELDPLQAAIFEVVQ